MNPIRMTATASLTNPNDPTEVTLVADAVGVGTTYRMASGHVITWTAEFLRAKAHSFIGKPVNIDLDEKGKATGHSRRVVGAITHAFFDERKQVVTVHAAIWPHYAPSTVAKIKDLAKDNDDNERPQVSMEFIPTAEMIANSDGSETPTDGEFSGLGIVGVGADPRNRLILVAALAEDEASEGAPMKPEDIIQLVRDRFSVTEKQTPEQERDERNAELMAAHEGSFEWFSRRLAEHLASKRSPDDYAAPYSYVIATFPKYAIYQEGESYFRIDYARKGREVTFEEPTEVDPTYSPVEATASEDQDAPETLSEEAPLETITDELRASLREEFLTELKPQLDELATLKAENETLKAEKAAGELAAAKEAKTQTRVEELDKIIPAKDDAARTARATQVADLEDAGFEALKAAYLSLAEVHGGINSDGERHAADAGETPVDPVDAEADQIIADMKASAEAANTSKEK